MVEFEGPEELLAQWPGIQRSERRMRRLDVIVPLALLALVWPNYGGGSLNQLALFLLGTAFGAVVMSALHRRRSYQHMRRSIETLQIAVSYYKGEDDE